MTTAALTIEVGTPLEMRGQLGFISGILGSDGNSSFMIGSEMTPVRNRYEVVWSDGGISTLPDAMAKPYIEIAAARGYAKAENIEELKNAAQAKHDTARQKREEENKRAAEIRAAFEVEAARRMPLGCPAVIVAELERDDSDAMTDYFNTKTARTVILGFSTHTRDLFSELRKAARLFSETAHLADAPEKAEHREKYSMGAGYYLKNSGRYSDGWAVRKVRLYDKGVRYIPTGDWADDLAPKAEAAAPVVASAPTISAGFKIESHVHTKKGFRMWIVILSDRVERAEFERLRTLAQSSGGWYSRPWGTTPGGFAFKSEEAANAFAGTGTAAPSTVTSETPAPHVVRDISEKLLSLADGMQGEIDSKFADRLRNTPKRKREADSARNDGFRLQRTQKALRALADLHKRGAVPEVLKGVNSKKAVFELMGSKIDCSRGGYYDAGIDTGKPSKQTPEALALWALLEPVSEETKQAEELRRKVGELAFKNIPGYFPTPSGVVARMIEAARIPFAGPVSILEPEGGSGAILDELRAKFPHARLGTYERHCSLSEILNLKGFEILGSDFLEASPSEKWDRILMNPPFENGQDIEHVRRAHSLLASGGRLVAIMSPGPFFRQDRKAVAFRDWFDDLGGERFALPSGSFKESGTGVETLMIVLDAR